MISNTFTPVFLLSAALTLGFGSTGLCQEADDDADINPPDDPIEIVVIDPAERARNARPEHPAIPGIVVIVDREGRLASGWRREQSCPSTLTASSSLTLTEESSDVDTAVMDAAASGECLNVVLRDRPGQGPDIAAAGRAMGPGFMRTGRGQEIIYMPPPPPAQQD